MQYPTRRQEERVVSDSVRRTVTHTDTSAESPPLKRRVPNIHSRSDKEPVLGREIGTHTGYERKYLIVLEVVLSKNPGNDFETVYNAVLEACGYIRSGNGPYLLEVMTYRFKGHSKSDRRLYRTSDEEQQWMLRDPILLFEQKMVDNGFATPDEITAIEDECRKGIELQAMTALKESDDKLTEQEVLGLVYASGEERS